ncbi:TspO/MBR family protein [Polycladospora coralii]|uniref:TspO/MBR family protein n=1 Tax=Polycladospora coralii TaxID=2771432 RepID=UPI001CD1394E|nr:TspO/MBR family protein [Polycladospora coralii]
MIKQKWLSLVVFIVLCFTVSILGALFTETGAGSWYDQLVKPSFNPPNAVFGPVWTVLYLFIALSGWLIYLKEPSQLRTKTMVIFIVQLLLNFAWSLIFFGFQQIGVAFFDIVVLWLVILLYIQTARQLSKVAAWLFVPYALWVSFATLLNGAIWLLNVS